MRTSLIYSSCLSVSRVELEDEKLAVSSSVASFRSVGIGISSTLYVPVGFGFVVGLEMEANSRFRSASFPSLLSTEAMLL